MENPTLEQMIEQLAINIADIQFDLKQDWNEHRQEMTLQLQNIAIAKANLEMAHEINSKLNHSSIA